jgi:3-hydroxybutyryl-CoA dehydrogenase
MHALKAKTKKISTKKTEKKKQNVRSEKPEELAQPSPEKPLVVMLGETPMVEPFAKFCAAHGYKVAVILNDPAADLDFHSPDIGIVREVPAHASIAVELTNLNLEQKKKNVERIGKAGSPETAILSSSLTVTATEQSLWIEQRHRLVGIAALPSFLEKPLMEVAPTIYSPKETLEAAAYFLQSLGIGMEIVQDRIGMVLPRILCRLINEAMFAVMEDHAAPQDIDTAVRLGLEFPVGPIAWAEQIGWPQVYAVLTAVYNDTHEERYRAAPLLRHMAVTGNWWKGQSS